MQVRPSLEEAKLKIVAAPIAAIADVQRLVEILHQMDQENRELAAAPRGEALGRRAFGESR